MRKPPLIIFLLGIILFLTPLLNASWDVWSKTIIHLLTIFFIIFLIFLYQPEILLKKPPITFIFLVLWIFTTSLFSQIKFNTEFELHNWINYFLIFLIIINLPYSYTHKSLSYFIICVLIIVFFALFQSLVKKDAMPDGNMVNPNVFAGYLIMAIPLLFSIRGNKYNIQKILILILILLSILTLTLTKSVSAFIGLLCAYIIIKYKWKGLILSFIVLMLFLSFKLNEPDVINRYLWWEACLKIIKDNPIFGTGVGTFEYVYPKYKTGALSSIFAHNYYLQLASEIGLPGIILFLSFIFFSFNKITNNYLKIGLLAILIQNIFEYNLYILANGILFWTMLGLGVNNVEPAPDNSVNNYQSNNRLLIKMVLILLLIIYSNGVIKLYSSTSYYNLAEISYNTGDLKLSETYLNKTIAIKPNFWLAYPKLSKIYLDKFNKIHYKSYLYEALSFSDTAKKYNKYYPYYYVKNN